MRVVPPPRSMMTALLRGARGRCPRCGKGPIFGKFLKVNDCCAVCGEELYHQQADDFPAYVVIFIVGHVMFGLILFVDTQFAPSLLTHLMLWIPATILLTVGLLQPVKGTIVALQWQIGMHGFEQAKKYRNSRTCP
jgi:uncharacterized protein (DUF983 family)